MSWPGKQLNQSEILLYDLAFVGDRFQIICALSMVYSIQLLFVLKCA